MLKSLGLTPEGDLPDIRVHYGGPVEPGALRAALTGLCDRRGDRPDRHAGRHDNHAGHSGRHRGGQGPRAAVLALGYAGWGAGQLEAEIARSDWLVGDLRADLIFGRADEFKWGAALKASGIDPCRPLGA